MPQKCQWCGKGGFQLCLWHSGFLGYKKLLLQWMRNMHIHLSKQEGWNENGSDFSITHIVQKFYDN